MTEIEPLEAVAPRRRRTALPLPRVLFVVLLLLIGLVLIGLGTAVLNFALDSRISNQAYVDNATTDEVKAAADNALSTVTAFKFDDMDGWANRSREVLTDDMRDQFDKTAEVTKSAAQQSKTSTEAKVDPTGVTLLDGDHAEVLAFVTVSVTDDGVVRGSQSDIQLARLAKVDGKWLLSEIVPL